MSSRYKRRTLLFPSILNGDYSSVQKNVTMEGKRWARSYQATQTFPEPDMALVEPGAIVYANEIADWDSRGPAWRLYFVTFICDEICRTFDWVDYRLIVSDFYSLVMRYPWGALASALEHAEPNSAANVSARLQAMLDFWDSLTVPFYLWTRPNELLTLEELVRTAFDYVLEFWSEPGCISAREALQHAAKRMRDASREEATSVVVNSMLALLPRCNELKHQDRLCDPTLLEMHLSTLQVVDWQRISAAWPPALLEHLRMWDEQLEA